MHVHERVSRIRWGARGHLVYGGPSESHGSTDCLGGSRRLGDIRTLAFYALY
jgi:hypothetical protein